MIRVLAVQGDKVQITDGKETSIYSREMLDSMIEEGEVEIEAIKVKCLNKIHNENKEVIAYILCDEKENQRHIGTSELKQIMYNYKINCVNLKLTSDYRIIDKREDVKGWIKKDYISKIQQEAKGSNSSIRELHVQYMKTSVDNKKNVCLDLFGDEHSRIHECCKNECILVEYDGIGEYSGDDGIKLHVLKSKKEHKYFVFVVALLQGSKFRTNTIEFAECGSIEGVCSFISRLATIIEKQFYY